MSVGARGQLGVTVVMESGICLNVNEEEIIKEFESVTYREGEILSATGQVEPEIELIGSGPMYVKPRRFPQTYEGIVKDQIQELLDTGIIEPSVSSLCSPLWVVPKPRTRMETPGTGQSWISGSWTSGPRRKVTPYLG